VIDPLVLLGWAVTATIVAAFVTVCYAYALRYWGIANDRLMRARKRLGTLSGGPLRDSYTTRGALTQSEAAAIKTEVDAIESILLGEDQ